MQADKALGLLPLLLSKGAEVCFGSMHSVMGFMEDIERCCQESCEIGWEALCDSRPAVLRVLFLRVRLHVFETIVCQHAAA